MKSKLLMIAMLAACGPAASDVESGANGSPGLSGVNGSNGSDGVSGSNGSDGADGVDGVTGADGADGADGLDGAAGADGVDGVCTGPGWADATGARIIEGNELIYVDTDGYEWAVDRNSGTTSSASDSTVFYFYEDPGCTGAIVISAFGTINAMQPFEIDDWPGFYVRPPTVQMTAIWFGSEMLPWGCENQGFYISSYYMSDMITDPSIVPPTITNDPPLYRVR